MRVVFVLAGLLVAGSVQAAEVPATDTQATDCAAIDSPTAELICRDAGLTAAMEGVNTALAALGQTTDDSGRAALEANQTLWLSRRNESCPVTAADLAEAKAARGRTDCLLRVSKARIAAIDAERTARGQPVTDLPLTITDAAAPRLVAAPSRPAAQTRPVSLVAMAGRWAKADPVGGAPVDDCRTSYLDVTRDQSVRLIDPRVPGPPIMGRLAADGDPIKGAALTAAETGAAETGVAALGSLRLVPAETPRLDRLVLRLEPPATFAATFVRCR